MPYHRTVARSCTALAIGTFLVAPAQAVINGEVADGIYTGVASLGGCSSVLVAPRVALTSAHCFVNLALGCQTLADASINVTFAEIAGGWSSQVSLNNRTVAVDSFALRQGIFDLSACDNGDAFNCSSSRRQDVDHSKELVVLYLAGEAPADAVELPILVSPHVDFSDSAGEFGVFPGLQTWLDQGERIVTTVGYGVGSQDYPVGDNRPRGRDFGVQRWIASETNFANFLGLSSCNSENPSTDEPGVVASPGDLTLDQLGGAPNSVTPGQNFEDSNQSHSGTGDSGGPVLVGQGPPANDVAPSTLPAPAPGASYDPNRNYVAGTASLWVGSGEMLATAFTPTWTLSASTFLRDALHDIDGDGYADPVDDDRDGDGCDNDVDQNPDDRWVEVGTVYNINCNPPTSPMLADESLDSDGDEIPDCRDINDDNDTLLDFQDHCPLVRGSACFSFGTTCPWNRQFFDCRLGGCNELGLKFSSLINPDPTTDIIFPIQSWSENTIVVGAAPGFSLRESANILAAGPGANLSAPSLPMFLLEVVGAGGEIRGSVAAYSPGDVRIGELDGAEALIIRLDGPGLVIEGLRAPPQPAPALGPAGLAGAAIALLLAAALRLIQTRMRGASADTLRE